MKTQGIFSRMDVLSSHYNRFSASTRWHTALSGWLSSLSPGTESRTWRCAAGVIRGENWSLPPLSAARTLSGLWRTNDEASPGERRPPSAASRRARVEARHVESRDLADHLGRLAASLPSARGGEAPAAPAYWHPVAWTVPTSSVPVGSPSFSCRASTLPTLVGPASGSQCTRPNCWSGDDQTVRGSTRMCRFARPSGRL